MDQVISLMVIPMTIRRILLFVLIFIVIVSITINGFILSSLTDRYFQTYLVDMHEERIEQIIEYVKNSMDDNNPSYERMRVELVTYLIDPITQLRIYNTEGNVLLDVYEDTPMHHGHMRGGMMRHMGGNDNEQIENYEILDDGGQEIGYLTVFANSSISNSIIARRFKSSLVSNSVISMIIALMISIVIGYFISKKMSSALKDTAKYAKGIEFNDLEKIEGSNIIEVRQIRESLEELSSRLSLKQQSRKELIDQLIHQTRTPLTIIRTHVEAIEDGIIEGNPKEMEVIYNEIHNISSIISNLSGMIDAQKETDDLNLEKVELHSLVKQIVVGLKGQFDKKEITLNLNSKKDVSIYTDRYKLSQILYNLLTNAYKYTGEKGYVNINYKLMDNRVSIEIEDTGIGISAEDQDKIFNAYYRSDNVINTQGDGIGLYLVMENIKLLNGEIKVESQLGEGSKFIVTLPK